MRITPTRPLSLTLAVLLLSTGPALAATPIPVGQIDDFQNGSLSGWGGQAVRTVVDGGPAGPGDLYLRVESDPLDVGHWGTQNHAQWGGNGFAGEIGKDYLANEITGIAMDVCNFGPETLHLRVLFTPNGGARYETDPVFIIEPGTGWQHVVFGISPNELVRVQGTGTQAGTLSDVARPVIHHAPDLTYEHGTNPPVTTIAGIDNITALGPRMPGDADLDGDVDLEDFVILKRNFGVTSGATWLMADFDGNGGVSLQDFVVLKQNFGTGVIPEPTTLSILAMAAIATVRRRR